MNIDSTQIVKLFSDKMVSSGQTSTVINNYVNYYKRVIAGETATIREHDILPLTDEMVTDYKALDDYSAAGCQELSKTVIIKLNGGLGTSMGCNGPKSLIEAKKGLSFLDIIARQLLCFNKKHGIRIPLMLMDSYTTGNAGIITLQKYPELTASLPFNFIQHKVPRLRADNYTPLSWPADPDLEWNPPGHGDIFLALSASGLLDRMIDLGYHTIFVSNSDNLGATLDEKILGYFVKHKLDFLMETAARTSMDKKGGHVARSVDGHFVLRELAQCPENGQSSFMDIGRHRFFNTNNLWINIAALKQMLKANNNHIDLPLIKNRKKLVDEKGAPVNIIQIETAMGTAISSFIKAGVIVVPRSRFIPVKKTSDLLVLWSDYYKLTPEYLCIRNPKATFDTITVDLDDRYFGTVDQLRQHFLQGFPSLAATSYFSIKGDVCFKHPVIIKGRVEITNSTDYQKTINQNSIDTSINFQIS